MAAKFCTAVLSLSALISIAAATALPEQDADLHKPIMVIDHIDVIDGKPVATYQEYDGHPQVGERSPLLMPPGDVFGRHLPLPPLIMPTFPVASTLR